MQSTRNQSMTGGLHLGNRNTDRNTGRADADPNWRFRENANPETANQSKASPSQLPTQLPPPPPKYPPPPPTTTTQGQDLGDIMRKLPPPPSGPAPPPPSEQDEFKEQLLEKIVDKAKNIKQVVIGFKSVKACSLVQFFEDYFKNYVKSEDYWIQVKYPKVGDVASITINFKKTISDIEDLSCINNLIQQLANTTFIEQGGQARCVICNYISEISNEKQHVLKLPSTSQDPSGLSSGSSGYPGSIQCSVTGRTSARILKGKLNKGL